ncbi:sugar transferase [Thermodesulfobacteriota bacterium B35]
MGEIRPGSVPSRPGRNRSWYLCYGKGLVDRVLALAGLVCLSPLLFALAIAVKLDSPGPVFFRHERVGRNFAPFQVYKFRSMIVNAASMGPEITRGGDPRVTRIGRFLRAYKLDELPQLINVLVGEMSLVGPRPEVARYVHMFRKDYETILVVKPGITDYAALEFRDEEAILRACADAEEAYVRHILPAKIALYKRYIARISFCEDVRVLLRTLLCLFQR